MEELKINQLAPNIKYRIKGHDTTDDSIYMVKNGVLYINSSGVWVPVSAYVSLYDTIFVTAESVFEIGDMVSNIEDGLEYEVVAIGMTFYTVVNDRAHPKIIKFSETHEYKLT